MSASVRPASRAGRLARLGFADPARADALLDDRAIAGLTDPLDDVFGDGLADALSQVADPDLALLGLDYRIHKMVSLIPNVEYVAYSETDGRPAPDDDLISRLTLYVQF